MSVDSKPENEIEAIREELARARREGGVSADGDQTTASAASMNFIVYVDQPEHRDWVVERAVKIAEKHPARLLILDANNESRGARLVAGDRSSTIRTERVDFAIADRTPAQLYAIANSLTISGLPTVLWWTGAYLTGEARFADLAEIADDVVVDSSGGARDERTVREVGTFLAANYDLSVVDLAWLRVAPWQDMIAQFFDEPSLREELFAIRSVKIAAGSDAEALYLGGWLGSRLGWVVCRRSTFCDRRGYEIPFVVECEGDVRRVTSVRIETGNSAYTASVCERDGRVVTLAIENNGGRTERVVPLQAVDNASLIERAILERSTNEIFETSLRMVGRLIA